MARARPRSGDRKLLKEEQPPMAKLAEHEEREPRIDALGDEIARSVRPAYSSRLDAGASDRGVPAMPDWWRSRKRKPDHC